MTWRLPSERVTVPNVPLAPDPPLGVVPEATLSGGHAVAQLRRKGVEDERAVVCSDVVGDEDDGLAGIEVRGPLDTWIAEQPDEKLRDEFEVEDADQLERNPPGPARVDVFFTGAPGFVASGNWARNGRAGCRGHRGGPGGGGFRL